MYHPLLRARNCKHLPRDVCHCVQHCLLVGFPLSPCVFRGIDCACRVSAFLIIFIEIPLLLRICPTSAKFDGFIRKIETNYMRAAFYAILSIVQWISIWPQATSLIVAAIFLMIAAIFYALAGIKGQAFQGSKTLGGQGVAQMII